MISKYDTMLKVLHTKFCRFPTKVEVYKELFICIQNFATRVEISQNTCFKSFKCKRSISVICFYIQTQFLIERKVKHLLSLLFLTPYFLRYKGFKYEESSLTCTCMIQKQSNSNFSFFFICTFKSFPLIKPVV